MEEGLVIVLTGEGKGKTTSALGMALRAAGQGLKVLILQFIKGDVFYGELKTLSHIPGIEIKPMGIGLVRKDRPAELELHKERAREALVEARRALVSGAYDMLILDEVLVAVKLGLIEEKELVALIKERPGSLHLVLTGRGATQQIVDLADTVTEMVEKKHHFTKIRRPVKGIEL